MNLSILYALAAAALFGASTPLAKNLGLGLSPVLLAGLLYLGSGVGLAGVRLIRDRGWKPSGLSPSEWPWLLGAIAFGGILGPVALMFGLTRTAGATASLMLNLESVLTALLAWVVVFVAHETWLVHRTGVTPGHTIAGLVIAFFALGWNRYLSMDLIREHGLNLQAYARAHWWTALAAFIAVYALATASTIPGPVFLTLLGGMMFGPYVGALAQATGATIGSVVIYYVYRTSIGSWLRAKFEADAGFMDRLAKGIDRNAFTTLFTLRVIPSVPFVLVNATAGMMAVLYRHFHLGEPISEAIRQLDKKYLHHQDLEYLPHNPLQIAQGSTQSKPSRQMGHQPAPQGAWLGRLSQRFLRLGR